MGEPRIERHAQTAYFIDATGDRFRVYDVLFAGGKKRIMRLEDAQANHRYFVAQSGIARAYRFERLEPRALRPERLQAQLGAAGYTAQTPLDIKALKPT